MTLLPIDHCSLSCLFQTLLDWDHRWMNENAVPLLIQTFGKTYGFDTVHPPKYKVECLDRYSTGWTSGISEEEFQKCIQIPSCAPNWSSYNVVFAPSSIVCFDFSDTHPKLTPSQKQRQQQGSTSTMSVPSFSSVASISSSSASLASLSTSVSNRFIPTTAHTALTSKSQVSAPKSSGRRDLDMLGL